MSATPATPDSFRAQLAELTLQLQGRPLDAALKASCEAGVAAGWLVCPPGSAHRPTVLGGRALVLYLLPQGQIQFT